MARPLRLEYSGAIYHVTGRMVGSWRDERLRLFRGSRDYRRFVERLGEGVEEYNVRLYSYCLMGNHYHLVLETPEGNLSRFMQKLITAYTVYYNRRHRRHGHLMDGRFKAKLVEGDEYLLKLSRYVHLNPVQVGRWKKRPVSERIAYLRAVACRFLLKFAGLTQREVSGFMGMGSGAAVSIQVKRYEDWLAVDARLGQMAGKTGRNLERKRRERSQAILTDH